MLGYEEKLERMELIDAVCDAGRLARGLDQLLESLAHADQLDPLDVDKREVRRAHRRRYAHLGGAERGPLRRGAGGETKTVVRAKRPNPPFEPPSLPA